MEWSHAPALESQQVANLEPSYRMFVDGTFVDGSGEPVTSIDPATGEVLAEVATAARSDVDRAVQAARRAHDRVWSRMAGTERAKHLLRIARLVQQRARELAVLESLDTGMPIRTSRVVDVPAAAAQLFYHAGWADKLGFAGYGPDPRPLGVAAAVISSESPLLSAAASIAPALACGNTVVLKPAETTPLTALVLGQVCQQAQLPPGVVNVVPGDDDVGAALVAHPGLDKVAFTGSTAVGKQVQHVLAGTGRRLTLELGGKGATIVFEDAPLDQAVEGIIDGISGGRGGGCGERLLVQQPIAEELLDRLRDRASALRVGDPLDRDTDVGAIVSRRRLDRIVELVDAGDAEGARRWTSPCPLPERGWFFPPTLLSDVSPAMRIAREEVAGPVLSMLTFRTPDEAVATVNNTPHGRAAAVWTEKGSRALWTAQRIRAGVVWANPADRSDPAAPHGGYQESGFGRGGGREGLAVHLDIDDGWQR